MSYRRPSIPPTPSNQPISPQSAFIGAHRQSDLHNGPFRGFSQAAQAQSQALSLGSISTAPHLSYSSHRAYLSAMNQDTSPTEQHLARLSQSTLREPFTPGPQPLRPPTRRPFDEVITGQKTPSPNQLLRSLLSTRQKTPHSSRTATGNGKEPEEDSEDNDDDDNDEAEDVPDEVNKHPSGNAEEGAEGEKPSFGGVSGEPGDNGDPPSPPGGGGGGNRGPSRRRRPDTIDDGLPPAVRKMILKVSRALDNYLDREIAPPAHRPKLADPDTFDGSNPSKLPSFLTQCTLIYARLPRDYPDDSSKTLHMLSFLRGTAQEYFQSDVLQIHAGITPFWLDNLELFVQELRDNFGPVNEIREAENTLHSLTMKPTDRIVSYILPFQRAAITSGWNDAALAYCFYRGLPARIKSEFARPGKPTTLLQMKQLAQDIDFFYWELQDELCREGHSVHSSNQSLTNLPSPSIPKSKGNPSFQQNLFSKRTPPSKSASSASPKPYSKFLGSDGKLLPEEKER